MSTTFACAVFRSLLAFVGLVSTVVPACAQGIVMQGERKKPSPTEEKQLKDDLRTAEQSGKSENVVESMMALGRFYEGSHSYEEARKWYQKALREQESATGPESLQVATILDVLGTMHFAEADFRRQIAERSSFQPRLAGTVTKSGASGDHLREQIENEIKRQSAILSEEMYKQAEKTLSRLLAIRVARLGPTEPDVIRNQITLAATFVGLRKYSKAADLYDKTLPVFESAVGPTDARLTDHLRFQARAHEATHDLANAEALYRRSLDLAEKLWGGDDTHVILPLEDLAAFLMRQKGDAESEPLRERAAKLREVIETQLRRR